MKNKHNKLTDNAYLVHLFTHQCKRMMKGFFDTAQKRNEFSSSFGRYRDGICESFSRFHEIGNTFVRTKVQLAKQSQVCNKGEISVFRENIKKRDREITKSCNRDIGTSKKYLLLR